MDKGGNEPEYVSTRLNGQIYERAKYLAEFLSRAINDESRQLPKLDELLLSKQEHHQYLAMAAEHYAKYDYVVRGLMDTYGIQCEGELFSSSYSSIRNRFSGRENDDMSFFTTTRVIEQRLWGIREATRQAFFASFGGNMEAQTDEDGICQEPPDNLILLAKAYYTIAYNSVGRKLLSFPWVASWDVLDMSRRSRLMGQPNNATVLRAMFNPFGDHLSDYTHLIILFLQRLPYALWTSYSAIASAIIHFHQPHASAIE